MTIFSRFWKRRKSKMNVAKDKKINKILLTARKGIKQLEKWKIKLIQNKIAIVVTDAALPRKKAAYGHD